MMPRSPRAPVLRSMALLAIADMAFLMEGEFHVLHVEELLYCLTRRSSAGQDLDQRGLVRGSPAFARTGRTTPFGDRPNFQQILRPFDLAEELARLRSSGGGHRWARK